MDNLLTWHLGKQPVWHQAGKPSRHPVVLVGKASHEALGQKEGNGCICRGFTSCWLSSKAAAPRLCRGSAPSDINKEKAQHPEGNPSSFPSAAHRAVMATNMLSLSLIFGKWQPTLDACLGLQPLSGCSAKQLP